MGIVYSIQHKFQNEVLTRDIMRSFESENKFLKMICACECVITIFEKLCNVQVQSFRYTYSQNMTAHTLFLDIQTEDRIL